MTHNIAFDLIQSGAAIYGDDWAVLDTKAGTPVAV